MIPGATVLLHAKLVSTALWPGVTRQAVAGCVHSVFRSAVNVLSRNGLLTVAAPQVGALPNGLVIREGVDFHALGLAPEMVVDGDGRCLQIPEANTVIDLTEAAPWSPQLVPSALSQLPSELASNLRVALPAAAAKAPPGGFGPLLAMLIPPSHWLPQPALPPLCEVAQRAMVAVLAGLDVGDHQQAVEAAQSLIGLGDGLTPSGDDFIVGLCAALRVAGHPCAEAFAAGCVRSARGRTTLVAETFLMHAARGEYSERVHTLLDAFFHSSPDALPNQVAEALGWGYSSGADLLLGVLLGLAAACYAHGGTANETVRAHAP